MKQLLIDNILFTYFKIPSNLKIPPFLALKNSFCDLYHFL